jgi:hypothetical protein
MGDVSESFKTALNIYQHKKLALPGMEVRENLKYVNDSINQVI